MKFDHRIQREYGTRFLSYKPALRVARRMWRSTVRRHIPACYMAQTYTRVETARGLGDSYTYWLRTTFLPTLEHRMAEVRI